MNADPTDEEKTTTSTPVAVKPRSRRAWILISVPLAVALALAGLIFTVQVSQTDDDGSKDSSSKCEGSLSDSDDDTAEKAASTEDDQVEVSDKGLTVGSRFGDGSPIIYGVELSNSSNLVAKDIKVSATIVDDKGSPLPSYYEPEKSLVDEFRIPYILPGREFGVGGKGLSQLLDSNAEIALDVEVEVAEWWQIDSQSVKFPQFDASIVSISVSAVHFNVASEYCDRLKTAMAGVLIRDADGNIIIGGDPESELERASSKSAVSYPSGGSSGWFVDFLGQDDYEEHFSVDPDSSNSQVFPYVLSGE